MNRSILLVDDNDGDVFLFRKAFRNLDVDVGLHWVSEVGQALEFLAKTNGFDDADTPGIIVLDINLPPRSGYEVLAAVLKSGTLAHIPVVMLSTADSALDRAKSLALGAVAHYGKPLSFAQYRPLLESIIDLIDEPHRDAPIQAYRKWHHRLALAQ